MISESDSLKTNEFLRRRKLRLQQVREQSKDIAKKVRQRAKVEKLRHVNIDPEKEKEYLERQEKLVKKLEELYVKGIKNVGTSHREAFEVTETGNAEAVDLSKLRGKEAVAELRRRRQEKLDEHKKQLDRKLQAREAANEISREKSLLPKSIPAKSAANKSVTDAAVEVNLDKPTENNKSESLKTNDMGTQWDFDSLPNEWIPAVPSLSLPKDDSIKDVENKSERSKRFNLFALSDEMPTSLRGGLTNLPNGRETVRPSLTLVSEYLQSRSLRLREPDAVIPSKRSTEELKALKQTIIRTRASKTEGTTTNEKSPHKPLSEHHKKNIVTIYNHSTRDTRDIPYEEDNVVVRDLNDDNDAYSQAVRESDVHISRDREHQNVIKDMRSKVAMTKQHVDKEYKDTMAFLNSLPKDKISRANRQAHLSEDRQHEQVERRQNKMQQEFQKINRQCRKHNCVNSSSRSASVRKSKSPTTDNLRGIQYAWMPVPESDDNLAIHTIPNVVKEGKTGNSVKFSDVDNYHEYRSRHKHTPPTKDTGDKPKKKVVETVIIEDGNDSSSSVVSDTSSIENNLINTKTRQKGDKDGLSDADRIIIYKVLNSKKDKKLKSSDVSKTTTHVNVSGNVNDKDQLNERSAHSSAKSVENRVSFEHLSEGIYRMVNKKGDNIASMCFETDGENMNTSEDECTCHCNRSNGQANSKGTVVMGDIVDNRSRCRSCKKRRTANSRVDRKSPTVQSSGSTSSFKTASEVKPNAMSEEGYIKLIDDGGQEAGKFYIGASGVLKNDAYEVVIQLRKKDNSPKDSQRNESKMSDRVSQESNTEKAQNADLNLNTANKSSEPNILLANEISQHLVNQAIEQVLVQDGNAKEVTEISSKTSASSHNKSTQSEAPKENQDIENVASKSVLIKPQTSDLGLGTTNQDYKEKISKQVPQRQFHNNSVKIRNDDLKLQPTASVHTQTSINSPNLQPIHIRMSSSSSTAYMSPPDMIMPKYLRQDYPITYDENHTPMPNLNLDDISAENTEEDLSEHYEECVCEQCRHINKLRMIRRNKNNRYNTPTPPNTASSNTHHPKSNEICEQTNKQTCKHKLRQSRYKKCSKTHSHRKLKNVASNKSSRNELKKTGTSTENRNKLKRNNEKNNINSKLNPVIKGYVNKLLALNKEGLKAIDVINQDCSAVSTPSSSIINDSTNINNQDPKVENKISLEQLKDILKQQIMYERQANLLMEKKYSCAEKTKLQILKKKSLHKVKSLNISKHLKNKRNIEMKPVDIRQECRSSNTSSSTKDTDNNNVKLPNNNKTHKQQSQSSSVSKPLKEMRETLVVNRNENIRLGPKTNSFTDSSSSENYRMAHRHKYSHSGGNSIRHRKLHSVSSDNDMKDRAKKQTPLHEPTITSTQTSINESEINFVKSAEDKLQNMEKIAELTEKCTKRLSNLAKVLDEVRKGKSLAYSHISTSETASESDQRPDKNNIEIKSFEPVIETSEITETTKSSKQLATQDQNVSVSTSDSSYLPFLADIPKPTKKRFNTTDDNSSVAANLAQIHSRNRTKPPPAMTRVHIKHTQDYVIPHELSTVLEVDSPMSVKLKNQSPHDDNASETHNKIDEIYDDRTQSKKEQSILKNKSEHLNHTQQNRLPGSHQTLQVDMSNNSKIQMMDLKQFNDIMLEPFISINEYAKQCNFGAIDEASNAELNPKEDIVNDELSSLHSDGSLPDVISELLKRKIISEPFKFDSPSNVNSTTISSESALSMLALSKMKKAKKVVVKPQVHTINKESAAETSDTLSISSNPDLENAFKKLGMGWASSTLKKTKERLALSSSSNTSSSSMTQFKIKKSNIEAPVLVSDTISSVANASKTPSKRIVVDHSKNFQQTSLSNSMTVKEFLTQELANKITFTNKSRSITEEEFVSLYETKMPEEMKNNTNTEERSNDSVNNNNNRARTSTPVQIFKSIMYNSSSSSNVSNGLFSNAEELSSVKMTSNSIRNHSQSDKDDLTIPNYSLKMKKSLSDRSKSD